MNSHSMLGGVFGAACLNEDVFFGYQSTLYSSLIHAYRISLTYKLFVIKKSQLQIRDNTHHRLLMF